MIPPGKTLAELASYLDSQSDPRIVMDAQYRIVAANKAYCREFGQGQAVVGRRCYEVSHRFTVPCDQAGESCPLKASQEGGDVQRVLHLHHTPRGEEHVEVETVPVRDDAGALAYFVETLRVIRQAQTRPAAQGVVGRAPAFTRMLSLVMRVAPSDAAVMLLGETGTGKELVARAIHEASPRAAGPFVPVDCSGLTETLFESELFGYEKGAFTGANHRKTGLVEAASGGTLFLDEIGELPLSMQAKLLRLLETGTYRRVGAVEALPSDFRIVCATHRDLSGMVESDEFRRDLFYRLDTFPIHVPSLGERVEDLPLLVESLLARVAPNRRLRLDEAAMAHLAARAFAGNIRELRNLLERASLLADGEVIQAQHLGGGEGRAEAALADGRWMTLDENERRFLDWAVANHRGTRRELAAKLGIGERTLFRKLHLAGVREGSAGS